MSAMPLQSKQGDPPARDPIVVGIGASAGGLAALKTFFQHVPEKTGVAFVVVVHLSPDHESHLAEVLQPHARIPVEQVTQPVPLEPDHVYIIPPGRNLSAIDTHLRLTDLPERGQGRAPIDHFFRTLAQTHDGAAVGVILSGTGADGTLGVKEIKAKGGIVIVQDPAEAEYDGMPQSAVATGLADLVLPLRDIPAAILRAAQTTPKVPVPDDEDGVEQPAAHVLRKIFAQLRTRTGSDFGRYKRSTLLRRIARRMQLRSIEMLDDYLQYLQQQPEEVAALADDLLVTVTGFFRDLEVFENLREQVIRKLFDDTKDGDDIRIWCVGCATGEEAYSLAILLLEEAARRNQRPAIQIFATDLHEPSLQRGRDGLYIGDIGKDVSPARLQRFFHKENGGYRIRKEVRELVVFAHHNLLSDPPFSRLDLITCRNLLIYLQRDIQHDVIELFHYALNADGFLVLGSSETAGAAELFVSVDKGQCIFRKRNVPAPHPRLPVFPALRTRAVAPAQPPAAQSAIAYGVLHEQMVERYAPPSLLISPDDKVLHLSEHVGRYLVHPGGELTGNVIKLVREELRIELRAALLDARRTRQPARSRLVMVRFNGDTRPVLLDVRPAVDSEREGFALVTFSEFDADAVRSLQEGEAALAKAHDDTAQRRLAAELEVTQRRLHDIISQYEATEEEMRASNEELQSANEELRSTLEELETSKEELQSLNEELQTVNQENRNKVEELAQLSGDLQNLLAASEVATLFLDREFRILRFTPKVATLFNVRPADRGRPLTDLTHRLGYDELMSDAQSVLDRLATAEREVQDATGAWYLTRLLPYRSSQDRIEGVVITFFDITERKRNEEALRQSERHLAAELEAMKHLHGLVTRLLVAPDLPAALDKVLAATIEISGAVMGNIRLLNKDDGTLEIVAQRGFQPELLESFRKVTVDGDSAYARALRAGERVIIQDVQADARYAPYREIAARAGYRAVQSTPLLSRDNEVMGVLSTHYAKPMLPSDRDLRVLDLYSRQAAEFIEHVRSRDALAAADRRKDEFLAVLGHELRNPLATIRHTVELLKRGKHTEGTRHSLEVVERQTGTLVRLVDDLLHVSRIVEGKIQLRMEPVELAAVVSNAVQESEHLVEASGHRVSLTLPEAGIWVHGDPVRLSQVFGNLLVNARRHTPAGGEIHVTVGSEDRHAVVSVRDSGVGIAAEDLSHIFEMFYQASPLAAQPREGLGIGLALVKALVELHRGTIEALSAGANQGSEFIVRLPLV
ncbi:MAG TPA: chemotaxis protein CheB [Burkholderiaceae bacterium]|nr:chemotaxis protein CheB [Burkholderiaceae bacterium]